MTVFLFFFPYIRQLVEGTEVLQQLELVPTENERPIQQCLIIGSGDIYA